MKVAITRIDEDGETLVAENLPFVEAFSIVVDLRWFAREHKEMWVDAGHEEPILFYRLGRPYNKN